jgi:8-oxo-dGTP diphosphatase
VLLLVRHAWAGDRADWDGDDGARPLDGAGRRQADALVEALARFPLRRLVSSPTVRCVQSFEPLARARGLEIETRPELAVDADGEAALRLIREAGDDAAHCTHGEVLEQLLGEPTEKGEVTVAELDGDDLRVLERFRV